MVRTFVKAKAQGSGLGARGPGYHVDGTDVFDVGKRRRLQASFKSSSVAGFVRVEAPSYAADHIPTLTVIPLRHYTCPGRVRQLGCGRGRARCGGAAPCTRRALREQLCHPSHTWGRFLGDGIGRRRRTRPNGHHKHSIVLFRFRCSKSRTSSFLSDRPVVCCRMC